MNIRTRRPTVFGWLHGDDLKARREREIWAEKMRIHAVATYTVGELVDSAMVNVVRRISLAELTDSESDGTVGSDIEYEVAVDSEWDLVAI